MSASPTPPGSGMRPADNDPQLFELLRVMVKRGSSDLHISSRHKPRVRISGDIVTLDEYEVLTPEKNYELLIEIMPDRNRHQFEDTGDTDFGLDVPGLARFRANVFRDRHGIGGVFRQIPSKILTADDLKLPKAVREFAHLSKGLVVVTGPTGSGKSTTLAALVDLINKTRDDHILTIEDPIEFVHESRRCLVNQREVHVHTKGFAQALRAALREDPDIVLIGEMRDRETVEIALETAETGHLVFGTLHTNTAASTVDRIIDQFPADRQNQIRTMLASSLKGVVAQTLCKKVGGGRVAALEILVVTLAVSGNIRDGKTHHILSSMQTGKMLGMQLLNEELIKLVANGVVEAREAYMKAADKRDITEKLKNAGLPFEFDAETAPVDALRARAPAAKPATTAAAAAPDPVDGLIRDFRAALAKDPNSIDALNNLGWILAASPTDRQRNGKEAVKLAERAHTLTGGKNPAILDTLAAASAESGDFKRAVAVAQQGIELALGLGDQQLADTLNLRLNSYRINQPIRDVF